jgi:hypothetical protein
MNVNFDDILKKAKGKVKGFGKSLEDEVKDEIATIMQSLTKLNSLFGHDTVHHLQVENIKCQKCNVTSFKLHVRDPTDPKRTLKFSKKDWTNNNGKFLCEKCK